MDFSLKFFEKNEYYEQKVKVGQSFVQYDVPEHAEVEQSEYLNDYGAVRNFFVTTSNLKNIPLFYKNIVASN